MRLQKNNLTLEGKSINSENTHPDQEYRYFWINMHIPPSKLVKLCLKLLFCRQRDTNMF